MRRLLAVLSLILLVLIGTGCSRPLDTAIVAANASGAFLTAAHGTIEDLHRQMRDHAVELALTEQDARVAVADVHTRFRPAWDVYSTAQTAWIVAAGAIEVAQAVEAAGGEPDLASVQASLLKLAAAVEQLRTTVAAVMRERGTQGGA